MWKLRSWKATVVFSIIVPISLLASFRISGLLQEPQSPETMQTGTSSWNMSRPANTVTIDEFVKNAYSDEQVSIESHVHVGYYLENSPLPPSDGDDDIVDIVVGLSANVTKGYIYSATIRFSKSDIHAFLEIKEDPIFIELKNMTNRLVQDEWVPGEEALFSAVAIKGALHCSLEATVSWVLLDKNDAAHYEEIAFETTYFDGAIFHKLIMPIQVGVIPS
jgi:hypothetical protein